MELFDFLSFSLTDIIDVALVTLLIYQLIKWIRGTSAFSIVLGILILYVLWLIVQALDMKLLSSILGQILGVGIIAILIIFQPEIRRFLLHLGNKYAREGAERSRILSFLFSNPHSEEMGSKNIEEIAMACRRMGEEKTGALIILPHKSSLEFVVETGDIIDAAINRRLIENLFTKNSPLHDGAMIISSSRIVATRCTLPIIDNPDIPPQYGMRHRAAVTITSDTDADAIVVSEETGNITFVSGGEMHLTTSISELKLFISDSYKK